jgi:hypothetical protein
VQISVTILWWPYLKASLFTPIQQLRGRALVFKSTAKGSGEAASAGLRTLGPSALLVLINVICIIVGLATFDPAVNAPQVIALCWCVSCTKVTLSMYECYTDSLTTAPSPRRTLQTCLGAAYPPKAPCNF